MDTDDWRANLSPDSRERIVNKILETLKRHLPFSGQEGLQELKKIAVRFEEKIYSAATSQSDYLRKISLKMLTMESKSQNTISGSANESEQLDQGASHSMQPEVHNRCQSLLIPLPADFSQAYQQLLSQNFRNNMTSTGVESSAGLQPAMTSVTGLTRTSIANASGQGSTVQYVASVPQNTVSNSMEQNMPANMYCNAQQQMQQQLMIMRNMQQSQLIGQQNSLGDMQHHQQKIFRNLQQQQQLMAQQNNFLSMFQQKLVSQSNVSCLQQQQQMLGMHSGNPSMPTNQQSVHMMQQPKVPMKQLLQQGATNLLPPQGQQSQPQHAQQQFMSQSLPAKLQQQMSVQEQSKPLRGDLQQRLKASGQAPGFMCQAQNVMDQQDQLYQSQRAIQEMPSNSTVQTGHENGSEWQEEAYQKLKQMEEIYFPELNEMYQKIAAELQQLDSLPQQPKSVEREKLKIFKSMLEQIMSILQMSKSNIQPGFKELLGSYEKQIINFINTNGTRQLIPPMQQGQLSQPHLPSMQQSQSQIPQLHSHDTQMNPQMQTMNMKGLVSGMQRNNMSSMQQVSSICSAPTPQQNTMHQLQSGSNVDSGQGNATSSLRRVTLPQNPVSTQQPNMKNLSSLSAVNMLQPSTPFKSNTDMSQLLLHPSKLEHLRNQQRQTPEVMQKMPQQQKQQLPAQMQMHQMLQVHQTNDVNEMKVRQEMGFNNKKLAGLQAQAPLLAILAFIFFVLCFLFVASCFEFVVGGESLGNW